MTATQPKQDYDWSQRYGPGWSAISKQTKNLQALQTDSGELVECAWCGKAVDWEEAQVHHVRYSLNGETLLRDDVLPLEDVYAVCGKKDKPSTCHHALHQPPLWRVVKENRVAGDGNSEEAIARLKTNTQKFLGGQTVNDRAADNNRNWRERFQQAGSRSREVYEDSWMLRAASWVLLSGLVAALTYVSWLNIGPYVALVKTLGVGSPNWLEEVPLIGALVGAWSGLIVTIVGLLVWSLIQALQVLWLLIGLDRRALRGAVNSAQSSRFQVSGYDASARRVSRKASRIPYFFIRWGALFSLGAYIFDLIVGLSLYPPAKNLNTFLFALSTGLWSRIDGPNLIKLLVMLFAFEMVLVLLIVVWQWIRTRQSVNP